MRVRAETGARRREKSRRQGEGDGKRQGKGGAKVSDAGDIGDGGEESRVQGAVGGGALSLLFYLR